MPMLKNPTQAGTSYGSASDSDTDAARHSLERRIDNLSEAVKRVESGLGELSFAVGQGMAAAAGAEKKIDALIEDQREMRKDIRAIVERVGAVSAETASRTQALALEDAEKKIAELNETNKHWSRWAINLLALAAVGAVAYLLTHPVLKGP